MTRMDGTKCLKCGARHFSSQPCPADSGSVGRGKEASGASNVTKVKKSKITGEGKITDEGALRARIKLLEARIAELEERELERRERNRDAVRRHRRKGK